MSLSETFAYGVRFHWLERYEPIDCNACFYACRGEAQAPLRLSRVRDVMARPPRERTAFNVAIENPLIIVHGDTATSQVIFTEYRQEKVGDPMKMTTQGKEYATWVKVNGQWLYKTRQIASGSNPPEGWKE